MMMETTHGRAFTFFPPPQNTDYFLCRGAACWSPSPPPSAAEGWRAARSWGGRAAVSRRASARPPPHPPGWVLLGGHGRLGDPGIRGGPRWTGRGRRWRCSALAWTRLRAKRRRRLHLQRRGGPGAALQEDLLQDFQVDR